MPELPSMLMVIEIYIHLFLLYGLTPFHSTKF